MRNTGHKIKNGVCLASCPLLRGKKGSFYKTLFFTVRRLYNGLFIFAALLMTKLRCVAARGCWAGDQSYTVHYTVLL